MATILLSILFAALTALVAHYWERVTPYILRHPFLVTADIFCAATILTVDGPSGPFFVATVLTATVAGLLFSARGMIAVVAFQMTSYFAALVIYSAWDAELRSDWAQDLLNAQILAVHPLLYPVAGYVGFQLRRIFLQLAAEQQRREIAEAQAAAAEERARLARDMHDSVAKTLRGAALAAQALPLWLKKDPERAARTADEVIKAAETAAREARDLISDLRDDTPDSPIEEILAFEVEAWSARSGVPAHFTASAEDPQLTVIARHEIVAILRESLTNVERHSGPTGSTSHWAQGLAQRTACTPPMTTPSCTSVTTDADSVPTVPQESRWGRTDCPTDRVTSGSSGCQSALIVLVDLSAWPLPPARVPG